MIGVSNYTANLLEEMTSYASVMPAVNQIEFTPSLQQPEVLKAAQKLGMLVTGYSMNRDLLYQKHAVIAEIAAKRDWSSF